MTAKFDQIREKGRHIEDNLSKNELDLFEELEKDTAISNHADAKELKHIVKLCAKYAIITAAIIGILMMIIFSLHLMLPVSWQWLNEQQLARMKDIILAASLSGFITTYARKLL